MRVMRWAGAVAVSVAALAGCGAGGQPSELRLYEFDCGRLAYDSPESVGFGVSDEETQVRELFVPCYLIEHPDGRLLWDGGLASDLAEEDGWVGTSASRSRLDRPLSEQLADLGLTFDSLSFVAFSHMHYDHVGVANELTRGTLLIQGKEFEAAFAEDVQVPGFDPALYEGLMGLERVLIDGDHDVFGDGRVRILSLPGHTPGHQALFVSLDDHGPIVLSGDLFHFRLSREKRIVPEFNVDAEATLRSMDRLEAFLSETGSELWIEHDLARWEAGRPALGYHK